MKKNLLLLLIAIISFNCYSQISYEKGYYINNSNEKVECLIKNIDWKSNPVDFKYKLSLNDNSKTEDIKTVKEFGIYNTLKYIKTSVEIDRSSSSVDNLSNDKAPSFKEEELFLKVLVEGMSNLYLYEDVNLTRFFYKKENSNIKQLIFKNYIISENKIGENNQFKHQLWSDLKCSAIKITNFPNLDYEKGELIDLFVKFNKCTSSEFINYEQKQKKDLINLTFRPRFNQTSLTAERISPNPVHFDFGNKTNFGFGVELEFILPFNKNKWSVSIEPTYQSFKSEHTAEVNTIFGEKLVAVADYHSIEVPISLRHYFFLNNNSKIFANISFSFDLETKSTIDIKRDDNANFSSLKIKKGGNLTYGIGYKFNDRYSMEMRYLSGVNILKHYTNWSSDYKTLSIIFGYSIF